MEYYSQKEVAKRIKHARKSANMTQGELAEALNMADNSIFRLESGKAGHTVDKLIEIAQILNVSTDYLLLGNSNKIEDKKNKMQRENNKMDSRLKEILSGKSEREIAYALEVLGSILSHTDMLTT